MLGTGEKKRKMIQKVLLKQRADERSSVSVVVLLSGCRCSAVTKETTDYFASL